MTNTKPSKIHILGISLLGLMILTNCQLKNPNESPEGEGAKLFDIDSPTAGRILSATEANAYIQKVKPSLEQRITSIMSNGRLFYAGGYFGKASSQGASFTTNCGIMADGKQGCYRSSEQQSYRTTDFGQVAPSKDARLDDLVKLSYLVSERSLSNTSGTNGSYSKIEIQENAPMQGTIIGKNISKASCMRIQAKDDRYHMNFDFYDCGDSFYGSSSRREKLEGAMGDSPASFKGGVEVHFAIEKASASTGN